MADLDPENTPRVPCPRCHGTGAPSTTSDGEWTFDGDTPPAAVVNREFHATARFVCRHCKGAGKLTVAEAAEVMLTAEHD